MDLRIVTLAERPTLKSAFVNEEAESWPGFMNEDPSVEHDYAVYVEPGVLVHHQL